MEIKNNSIIHTVRDFALENFGVELTDEQISAELRGLNFSGTLQLTSALKDNDKDLFAKYITLDLEEGYTIMPPMDTERYQARDGLEGPFTMRSGKVVYYDASEGKYYDPDSDYYMDYDEYQQHDSDPRMTREAQSPGVVAQLNKGRDDDEEQLDEMLPIIAPVIGAIGRVALGLGVRSLAGASTPETKPDTKMTSRTDHPSELPKTATEYNAYHKAQRNEAFEPHMMYSKDGSEEKYADTEELHLELKDKGWAHELEERSVAGSPGGNSSYGSNTVSTGRTVPKDPDDAQQDANSDASASNSAAANDNAGEIARLKKLAGIK